MNKSEILNAIDLNNRNNFGKIISYFALIIILIAIIFNTITFLVFRFNSKMKKIPTMVILSFVCITDSLSLFTWNLDHFFEFHNLPDIESLNIYTCKIFLFLQYFGLQSSAFLICFVSIDRYFTIISKPGSFISKLPFGTIKSSFIWSFLIIIFIACLNSILIIFDRVMKDEKLINCYRFSNGFSVILWEKIHLCLYSILPFILMITFNVLLIKKTLRLDVNNTNKSSLKKTRNLTLSILIITICFILMSFPASFCFGFYLDYFRSSQSLYNIAILIDYFSFLNHSTLFFNCILTNKRFREIIYSNVKILLLLFCCHRCRLGRQKSTQ